MRVAHALRVRRSRPTLDCMKAPLLLVVFLIVLANAAADGPRLVNPQPSAFRATDVREADEHIAKFAGLARVSGTLYIDWSGATSPIAEYRLIPSKNSSKRLPHFRGYRVTWIEPVDGSATLRTAVDGATYERVLGGKAPFRVTGSWWVSNYEVGIECDAPYAHATIRFARTPTLAMASIKKPETC